MADTNNSPVIAVFGAGAGLGSSVAHRFGREGFRVALVGRRLGPLEALQARLTATGIEAATFPADLSRTDEIQPLIDAIRTRFGRIDVIEYGPVSAQLATAPAREITAEALRELGDLYLLTPVEIARLVLPELLERGSGSVLFTIAANSLTPAAGFAGPGIIQVAAHHYLQTLNLELADTGVYAGTVLVDGVITGSELAQLVQDRMPPEIFEQMPIADPDGIAEQYWQLHTTQDRFEARFPPS